MAHRQQLMADRTERAAIPYRTDQRQITMLPLFRFEADKRVQDPDPLNFKFFLLFFFSSPASFLPSATVLGLVHSANLRFHTPQLLSLILRGTLRFHRHMAKRYLKIVCGIYGRTYDLQ